nr:hypothetical protein CFP56_07631 [Quercus suber]
MTETLFSSLEDTMSRDINGAPPEADAIARRSISIFSRRGPDRPEPQTSLFIAQEVTGPPRLTKRMSERQKSWLGRKKGISGSNLKKSRGTVLHAVPAAKLINMTALEEAMATSPNQEILSAVSDQPPAGLVFTSSPAEITSPQQHTLWSNGPASPTARSDSTKRRDQANRIGVWVSGVTHWDDQRDIALKKPNITAPRNLTENEAPVIAATKRELSVAIPSNKPFVSETAVATIVRSTASRAVLCVTPPTLVSKFSASSPAVATKYSRSAPTMSVDRSKSSTPPPSTGSLEIIDSPASRKQKASRRSSSSCSSVVERDDVSVHSRSSSATSVADNHSSKSSKVGDGPADVRDKYKLGGSGEQEEIVGGHNNLDKPLPPIPTPSPIWSEPVFAPLALSSVNHSSSNLHIAASTRSAPGSRKVDARRSVEEPGVMRRSVSVLDRYDQDFITSKPQGLGISKSDSPTLSQAENELRNELSHISEDEAVQEIVAATPLSSLGRGDSVRSVMHPPERAPTVPRRSRKREWCRSPQGRTSHAEKLPLRSRSESHLRDPADEGTQEENVTDVEEPSARGRTVRRSMSESQLSAVKIRSTSADAPEAVLLAPQIVIDDGLIVVEEELMVAGEPCLQGEDMQAKAAASAEDVLLHILQSLKSPTDLFNTAQINKGMYRVYKENAMHLIRAVTYNQSPAAWEFREWCHPEATGAEPSQLDYTPLIYMKSHARDLAVVESLKSQILGHCQSFIRRETAFAISTPSHPGAQRFTDAFWRIWCFCEIFGGKKGRLEDVTGQLDWLRGGLLAENQGCVATVNTNLDYELSSVLLNAPEFFAKGNPEGLSSKQLYDMTELWTCLTALLSGYSGRIDQARDNGVFDGCDVEAGDIEKEGQMLEEWLDHILTLGPAVIVKMAEHANDSNSTGFTLARRNGWTSWSPSQYNASRSTFLKEPVSRLYEERVIAAAVQSQSPLEQERKEMSRKRVASLAAEIRLARQASSYKRLPLIDMHSERAMSTDRRVNPVSVGTQDAIFNQAGRTGGLVSPLLSPNMSAPSPMTPEFSPQIQPVSPAPSPATTCTSAPITPPIPPRRQYRRTPRIQITQHQRKISPIIEDRVETFNRMSLLQFGNGIAEDTSGLAVRKIVEMGFTPEQASEALRATDMGDGLRVDRAVELLVRQR